MKKAHTPGPWTDHEMPSLPKVGPICYAMAADIELYRVPRVGQHLPGVYDKRLEGELSKAVAAMDFGRAAVLRDIGLAEGAPLFGGTMQVISR